MWTGPRQASWPVTPFEPSKPSDFCLFRISFLHQFSFFFLITIHPNLSSVIYILANFFEIHFLPDVITYLNCSHPQTTRCPCWTSSSSFIGMLPHIRHCRDATLPSLLTDVLKGTAVSSCPTWHTSPFILFSSFLFMEVKIQKRLLGCLWPLMKKTGTTLLYLII